MFNILVPVDGSENALLALALAQAIAIATRRGDACLHLVNIQPRMNRHAARFVSRRTLAEVHTGAGRARLAEAERRVREAGLQFRSTVLSGEPAAVAAQYAKERGVGQIVVGTARKSTLLRLVGGSFTNDLVQSANVPVEVVAGRYPGLLERIGVPAGVGLGLTTLLLVD
jgi:nucleotide-binding universal stress UspA family protein